MHTHPNSLISGVFYFGEGSPKTSVVRFHKMSLNVNTPVIRPKLVSDKRELKYAQSEFNIEFIPGLLLLFPSYLHHSVPLNNTDKVRCSLAFNVVPTIGFGDERELTELKF
jgi:ectoine hydroxylase-related dioxygenase (phytanoyl-CoA dioxygenase family)